MYSCDEYTINGYMLYITMMNKNTNKAISIKIDMNFSW
jgi:hypothetical protein